MPDKADKLVKLARAELSKLLPFTAAEYKMLRATAKGETAYCNFGGDPDPANAAKWNRDRTIRAEILRWLCIDAEAKKPHGVQILTARIDGNINLAFANVPFPLALLSCAVPDGIDLMDAETRSLNFSTSHIGPTSGESKKNIVPLRADRLIVKGSLFLRDVVVRGEASLLHAKITGDMVCIGGQFENKNARALNADGIEIGGAVFLNDGFRAIGEVRLFGAKIAGQLSCEGGRFENENKKRPIALNADGAEIGGGVFLKEGFIATGEVRLLNVKIKGQLSCGGGQFINPDGNALSADGAEINGGIFLNEGLNAQGQIRLLDAKIKGNLACNGGRFGNKNGYALNVDRAEINGSVFLNGDFHAIGEICLLGVKITGQLTCRNGKFLNPGSRALNADDAEIGGGLFMDEGFRINGWLSLAHASVGVLADDPKCWPAQGLLVIDGFEYRAINPPGLTDARSRKDWLQRQYPKGAKRKDNLFRPQPYEQLARVLHLAGHEEEAKKILMVKEDDRCKYSQMGFFARLWNRVLKYTIGNGYRVRRVLAWALLVVLIGTIFFAWAGAKGGMVPAKERVYMESDSYKSTRTPPDEYPQFNCFLYSLDCFIPVVDLHQESYWEPMWENRAGCAARIYLWGHILAGWILTTLGLVGITGLVRKELPKNKPPARWKVCLYLAILYIGRGFGVAVGAHACYNVVVAIV